MPYSVPVLSVSTQPRSVSVRRSMYRLLFGYPRRCWSSARLCRPRCPAKYSSSSTVRSADLTGPAWTSALITYLELPVHPPGEPQRVVLGQLRREQTGRRVLVRHRTQEAPDRGGTDGGVRRERGRRPRSAMVLGPGDRDAGREAVPHDL